MPGMDTTAMASTMAMVTTDTGLMAMDTTMERGLLMLSLLLRLLLPLRLIPGMDTTTERGLLMLSPLLRLLLPLRLRLIPGMDTTVMDTGLMPMDTTDTGPMVITGERSKKP